MVNAILLTMKNTYKIAGTASKLGLRHYVVTTVKGIWSEKWTNEYVGQHLHKIQTYQKNQIPNKQTKQLALKLE